MASINEMMQYANYMSELRKPKPTDLDKLVGGVSNIATGYLNAQQAAQDRKLALALKMIDVRQKQAEAQLAEQETQMFTNIQNRIFNTQTPSEQENTPAFSTDKNQSARISDMLNGIGIFRIKLSSKGGAEIDYTQPKQYAGTTEIIPKNDTELKEFSDYFTGKEFEIGKITTLKTSEYNKYLGRNGTGSSVKTDPIFNNLNSLAGKAQKEEQDAIKNYGPNSTEAQVARKKFVDLTVAAKDRISKISQYDVPDYKKEEILKENKWYQPFGLGNKPEEVIVKTQNGQETVRVEKADEKGVMKQYDMPKANLDKALKKGYKLVK